METEKTTETRTWQNAIEEHDKNEEQTMEAIRQHAIQGMKNKKVDITWWYVRVLTLKILTNAIAEEKRFLLREVSSTPVLSERNIEDVSPTMMPASSVQKKTDLEHKIDRTK